MTRTALGLMWGEVLISPSQEEILEAIPGVDDVLQQTGRIMDETPSQPLDDEMSTDPSSLQGVFDLTGSTTLSNPSGQAAELVSPPTPEEEEAEADADADAEIEAMSPPRAVRDDSLYNEAFESDRSQSPSRRLSWGLAANAAAHGSSKDVVPRSPSPFSGTAAAALEEIEEGPMELSLEGEAAAPALPQSMAEASARDNRQLEALQTAAAAILVWSASGGVGGIVSPRIPRIPHLPLDNEGVENPSVASQDNFESRSGARGKRKGETCSSAASEDKNPARMEEPKAGSMDEVSAHPAAVPPTADNNKSLTLKGWANSSEDNSERGDCAFSKLTDDGLNKDGNQGPNSVAEPVPVPTSALQNDAAVGERHGIDTRSSTNKSENIAKARRAVDNSEVTAGIAEDGGHEQQQRHYSPPRPPPAVQEKLDRLRGQSGKRVCTEKSTTNITDGGRFRQPRSLPDAVMDAVRVRSGEKFAGLGRPVTAAELLKTAINRGISFPACIDKLLR